MTRLQWCGGMASHHGEAEDRAVHLERERPRASVRLVKRFERLVEGQEVLDSGVGCPGLYYYVTILL